MIPTDKCDRTVFKEWGVGKITSLVYTQVELPPLIPPCKASVYTQVELPPLIPPYKGGKQEKSGSLPLQRGGLGRGKTYASSQFTE